MPNIFLTYFKEIKTLWNPKSQMIFFQIFLNKSNSNTKIIKLSKWRTIVNPLIPYNGWKMEFRLIQKYFKYDYLKLFGFSTGPTIWHENEDITGGFDRIRRRIKSHPNLWNSASANVKISKYTWSWHEIVIISQERKLGSIVADISDKYSDLQSINKNCRLIICDE